MDCKDKKFTWEDGSRHAVSPVGALNEAVHKFMSKNINLVVEWSLREVLEKNRSTTIDVKMTVDNNIFEEKGQGHFQPAKHHLAFKMLKILDAFYPRWQSHL